MITEKLCPKCGDTKLAEKFSKSSSSKTGLRSYCKECASKNRKKYYKENIDKEKQYRDDNKSKYKDYNDNYYQKNKEELKKKRLQYYYDNYEYSLAKNKKYREENPEKMAEYKRVWEKKNRKMLNERKNKFNKENPHIITWRSLLQNTIKRMNTIKEKRTIEELGYSAEELKNDMINKFTEGMNWQNHGEWHIDHIKPVSSFDKNTPPKIVSALSNLQPLWSTTREINGVIYEGNLNKGSN